jgi:hypothetical protein
VGKSNVAKILDISDVARGRNVFIVGDLHGCFDEFMQCLRIAESHGFVVGEDVIISTGDITDRGPKILECFKFLMETNNCYVVASNHDDKFRRHLIGNPVNMHSMVATLDQTRKWLLSKSNYDSMLKFLQNMHHIVMFDRTAVAHASFDSFLGITEQRVDTCLYGRKHLYRMVHGIDRCVFGHHVWPSPMLTDDISLKVFMADGGCVFGKEMRAFLFLKNEKECDPITISIPSARNYFEEFKSKYHPKVIIPVSVFSHQT